MSRVIEVVRRGPRGTDGIPGASGAKIFIASQDASASATLNFTGFDGALYDGYYFHIVNLTPSTDNVLFLVRVSDDGGATHKSSGYSNIIRRSFNASGDVQNTGTTAAMEIARSIGNAAGEEGLSGGLWIYGPHLVKKTMMSFDGAFFGTDGLMVDVRSKGSYNTAVAINALQFLPDAGTFTSGTITMYGLKNSV